MLFNLPIYHQSNFLTKLTLPKHYYLIYLNDFSDHLKLEYYKRRSLKIIIKNWHSYQYRKNWKPKVTYLGNIKCHYPVKKALQIFRQP